MKRFGQLAGIALVVLGIHSAAAAAAHTQSPAAGASGGLHISDGTLHRGEALVTSHFSISKSETGYIFIYVPQFGLITLAAQPFPGAEMQGMFDGNALTFTADGERFVIGSSGTIHPPKGGDAWVSVDRTFLLRVQAPMVAYGDSPRMPYKWPMREVASQ